MSRAYSFGLHRSARPARLALAVVVLSALIFAAAAAVCETTCPACRRSCRSTSLRWYHRPDHRSAAVRPFGIAHSRALLVLGALPVQRRHGGRAHASFPGLFAPGGLLGPARRPPAWLYFLWHARFPLLVIAYAVLKEDLPAQTTAERPPGTGTAILMSVALVLAAACGLILPPRMMHVGLPGIMRGDRDASTSPRRLGLLGAQPGRAARPVATQAHSLATCG